MSLETDWQDRKDLVYTDIDALLSQGIPVETAKHLAGWNPTLAYDTFADMQSGLGSPVVGYRDLVRINVSRSAGRVNPEQLEDSVLDAGKLYAVFIQDVPELNILDITFSLNGSTVHHEFSAPWDYAGTGGGGEANRVTFIAGSYEVEAIINATGGFFSITSAFTVE